MRYYNSRRTHSFPSTNMRWPSILGLLLVLIREALPGEFQRKDALQWFRDETEKNPNDKSIWFGMGMLLAKTGEYEKAVDAFGRVTWLDPKHIKAWDARAKAFVKLGRFQEAIGCFDRALKLDSWDERMWFHKGRALVELGSHEEALACFEKAIELDPNYSDAWYGRGEALKELKGQEESTEREHVSSDDEEEISASGNSDTSEVLATDELDHTQSTPELESRFSDMTDKEDLLLAANVERFGGKVDHALDLYDRAIEMDPDFLDAWYMKGTLLYITDNYEDALRCFERVLEINPNHEWSKKRMAEIEMLIERKTPKRNDTSPRAEIAIENDKNSPLDLTVTRAFKDSWNRTISKERLAKKIEECLLVGEYENALAFCDNLLEVDWNDPRAWKTKGHIYSKLGREVDAERCFERALLSSPKHEALSHGEEDSFETHLKQPENMAALKRAMDLDPRLADAWCETEMILGSLGVSKDAHKALREAFEECFLQILQENDQLDSNEDKVTFAVEELRRPREPSSTTSGDSEIDEFDRNILSALSSRAQTVVQLAQELGLPKEDCHSRVQKLHSYGLLRRYSYRDVSDPERHSIDAYKVNARVKTPMLELEKLASGISLRHGNNDKAKKPRARVAMRTEGIKACH